MMPRQDLLDLPVRRRIFEFIRSNPGVHFREVQRYLGLAVGQLDFHLNSLVKGDVLVRESVSGEVNFYVRDKFSIEEKRALSILRREIPRGIVLFLLEHPGSNPGRVQESFIFTSATLSYHLRRLERAGVLIAEQKGRERKYSVKDPELIRSLLVMYRTSLFDVIIDRVP
jgi:predicted transcriptional regulator